MTNLNNPAERLEYWLRAGQRVPGDTPAYKAWTTVWDLEPESLEGRSDYLRRASAMMRLGVEVRRVSETIVPMGPAALEHFDEVESALAGFMSSGNTKIQGQMGRIGDMGWYSLSLLSTLLASGQRNDFDAAAEADLVEQTRSLRDAIVADDDLPDAVKAELVQRLLDVEAILQRVQIVGTTEAEAAVDGLVGCLVRLWARGVAVTTHPATQGVFALVNAITVAMGVSADYLALAGPLGDALGGQIEPTAT